mmetsp:Transcript_88871/g.162960  ORF Transcript_88871/g.162960 Transcript_88871/m.162960 type:complete len:597 (-) Transcript_88871:71-1861(-)
MNGGLPGAMQVMKNTPAMRAMMQAMQEMNSEVFVGKAPPTIPDGMQGQLHVAPQGGPTPHRQEQFDSGGVQELDPQQLQLLQMQAALLQMANSGTAAGAAAGAATAHATPAASVDSAPKVTAATIAASLPNELMTFGIGPLGAMDMSQSAGGWRNAKGRDGLRVSTMQDRQPIVATQRVYTGIVKSFDIVKKSGFIECDEIRQLMQQDVYVFQDVLARGNAGIADIVCFALHMSGKNKIQASSPLIRLATHNGFAQTGVFQAASGDSASLGGQIDCFEVKRVFGRSVRVPKELADQLKVGRRAGFNCTVDAEGVCRAYAGETVADDYAPSPGDLTQSWTIPGYETQSAAPSQAQPSQSSIPAAFGVPSLGLAGLMGAGDDASAVSRAPAAFAVGSGGATSSVGPPVAFSSGPASSLTSMMAGAGGLSSLMGGALGMMGLDSMSMAAMAMNGLGVGGKTGNVPLGGLAGTGIDPLLMAAAKPMLEAPPAGSLPTAFPALAAMNGGIGSTIPAMSAMSATIPASRPADTAATVSPEAYSDGIVRHMEQLRGMMRVDENLLKAAGLTLPPPGAADAYESLLGEKRKGEDDAAEGAKRRR